MCGIIATFPSDEELIKSSMKYLQERGPDQQQIMNFSFVSIGVARLSITDVENGSQPIFSNSGKTVVIFNGAIYNHNYLKEQLGSNFKSNNDGEVITELYEKYNLSFADKIEGMYAIILIDLERKRVVIATDTVGIKALHWVYDNGKFIAASTIQAIPEEYYSMVKKVPSGIVWSSDGDVYAIKPIAKVTSNDLLTQLRLTVRSHIPEEVPWACMLSGGVDSSLITALSTENSRRPTIAYSIGTEFSEDLYFAERISKELDLDHRVIRITEQDILNVAERVVEVTANYDPLTVLCGIGTYILSRQASLDGIKVLISGEGADELFGGYDEYKVESLDSLNITLNRDINELGSTECLRLDRCTMANGIEARVPFLGLPIILQAKSTPAQDKIIREGNNFITKYLLRKHASKVLPGFIANREKNPFFRGSGINNIAEACANQIISNNNLEKITERYDKYKIKTKLAAWFFDIWIRKYKNLAKSLDDLVNRDLSRKLRIRNSV